VIRFDDISKSGRLVRISDFEVLTFDCYGTLIDWETGIARYLGAWAVRHGLAAATRFAVPPVDEEARGFATSVGDWPAFPDTPAALRELKKRYRLLVVSNVDRESFSRTRPKLGVELDGLVIAEDVGAYKPDLRMFERTFAVVHEMGVDRSKILHVAQSLFHDHVPAKKLGLKTVWLNRRKGREGWGATRPPAGEVSPDIEVASLSDLVALDDQQRKS
jgi:2-haloacid dehalogenase